MRSEEVIEKIHAYYNKRGLCWPTPEQALLWAMTEIGEAADVLLEMHGDWVRNHPENKRADAGAFAEELGDAIMMLMVAGLEAGADPLQALLNKMQRIEDEIDGS